MNAHAARECTKDYMILCLWTEDFDLKRCVWIGFLHNADKFNDILRQKAIRGYKPKEVTRQNGLEQASMSKKVEFLVKNLAKVKNYCLSGTL